MKQNTTDNLAWLYQLRGSQVRPGLERIQTFLRHLGLLPLPFDVIHIAGTNGKGSTANYVFSILTSHGINCGLYTSPHLVRFNERIRSAAGMIDDAFIEEFIDQHRGHIEASEITFFEATTAMALAWFRHCRLQVAILETGLGGRLDATNICQPVLTGMTRIAMDHMHLLGTTLEEIAREKLGIVKNGIPLYSVPQAASLGELFRTHCKAQGAALGFIRPDNIRGNAPSLTFSLGGRDWQLAMQGRHQAENAALALTLARHYLADAFTAELAQHALLATIWQGRCQVVRHNPPLIYDVAHNPSGIKALVAVLQEIRPGPVWRGMFALMADKDVAAIIPLLHEHFSELLVFGLPMPRAMPAEELVGMLHKEKLRARAADLKALPQLIEEKQTSVVFGSHFLLAQTLSHGSG